MFILLKFSDIDHTSLAQAHAHTHARTLTHTHMDMTLNTHTYVNRVRQSAGAREHCSKAASYFVGRRGRKTERKNKVKENKKEKLMKKMNHQIKKARGKIV